VDLQATSPEVYGSKSKSQIHPICDFDSFLQCTGARNRRSPGYKPRSWGRDLGAHFHALEGPVATATLKCPDVFDSRIMNNNIPIATRCQNGDIAGPRYAAVTVGRIRCPPEQGRSRSAGYPPILVESNWQG